MLEVRAVVVLLAREAPLFSWMTTVTMSPTRCAFLSANMEVGVASAFHRESAPNVVNCKINRTMARCVASQSDKHQVLSLYFSIKFTSGFGVAHAHRLPQRAILQGFDLQRNGHGALLEPGLHQLSAAQHQPGAAQAAP